MQKLLGVTRISMGVVFLWPFLDKLLGLKFTTCVTSQILCEDAWINGGSPTTGFLQHATQGPLQDVFSAISGMVVVDWLFMLGLFCIGVALIFGVATKIATISGTVMMGLMYLAVMPLASNNLVDHHIIYSLLLWILYLSKAQKYLGFGK